MRPQIKMKKGSEGDAKVHGQLSCPHRPQTGEKNITVVGIVMIPPTAPHTVKKNLSLRAHIQVI